MFHQTVISSYYEAITIVFNVIRLYYISDKHVEYLQILEEII